MGKQTLQQNVNPNLVKGNPTKDFFISMLVKDITLKDAIGDLVDNAVDAIKAKANNSENLKGYVIDINGAHDKFSITDNGSGMEAETARKYAFNFGKDPDHKLINNSIGQFGIGMKRAFFKLGSKIEVQSVAFKSEFNLTIDVNNWQKDIKTWDFAFDSNTLKENINVDPSKTGLIINISNLSDDSTISFNDKNFIDSLQKEIALEHMLNINKGLTIKINGLVLTAAQITLVNNDKIKPTYWEDIGTDQSVKILAGISTKDEYDGGWYIFCNDRLIVAKNQTEETVWTGRQREGVSKYHSQYHRFRGYVFFEAKDSSKLPWKTTKDGMDKDSPYYKAARNKMIIMTRQVMDLLDKLKEEKEKGNPQESQILNKEVEKSINSAEPVTEVMKKVASLNYQFHYPKELFNPAPKSKSIKILYQVSPENYQAVKQHLSAENPGEVGLKTFNYYLDNEI